MAAPSGSGMFAEVGTTRPLQYCCNSCYKNSLVTIEAMPTKDIHFHFDRSFKWKVAANRNLLTLYFDETASILICYHRNHVLCELQQVAAAFNNNYVYQLLDYSLEGLDLLAFQLFLDSVNVNKCCIFVDGCRNLCYHFFHSSLNNKRISSSNTSSMVIGFLLPACPWLNSLVNPSSA